MKEFENEPRGSMKKEKKYAFLKCHLYDFQAFRKKIEKVFNFEAFRHKMWKKPNTVFTIP